MDSETSLEFDYSRGTEEPPTSAADIIGVDDRQQIQNTLTLDLRMLVRLKVHLPGLPPRRATGFMISPSTVLTAAHALCSRLVSGNVVHATQAFAAAASAGPNQYPFEDLGCTEFAVAQQFLGNQNPLFDYGVVQLPEPLGDKIGFFGLRLFKDSHLQNRSFILAGFPDAELPRTERPKLIVDDTMWGMMGPVTGAPQFLTYVLDATTGQSGSPIYSKFQENGKTVFLAAGLHQGGNFQQNHAVRFRPDILQEIGPWRQ